MAKSRERGEHSGDGERSAPPRQDPGRAGGEAAQAVAPNVVAEAGDTLSRVPTGLKASTFARLQRTVGNRVARTLLPQAGPTGTPASVAARQAITGSGSDESTSTIKPNATIQRVVSVATPSYLPPPDPVKTWSLTAEQHTLYQELVARTETYRFRDEGALVDFVRHYGKWFSQNPSGFWAQATGDNLAQVVSATVGAAVETTSELSYPITLTLDNSRTIQVNVFASKRRHLAKNLTINKEWPAESKIDNAIVMSPDKFGAALKGYAQDHADAIKARHMLQGYEPTKTKHGTAAAEIEFHTDQQELPNESYGRTNALHSFPNVGKEVYRPDQDSFTKLVALCSYLYNTDEYQGATRVDPQKRGDRENLLAGWRKSTDPTGDAAKTLAKATARGNDLVDKMKLLAANKYTNTADSAALAAEWMKLPGPQKGPLLAALNYCITNLYDVLFSYGAIPEVGAASSITVEVDEAAEAYDAIKTDGGATWKLLQAIVVEYKPVRAYPPVAVGGDQKTRKEKYDFARKDTKDKMMAGSPAQKIATLQKLQKAGADAKPPVVFGVDL